jgi:hypothetical protein
MGTWVFLAAGVYSWETETVSGDVEKVPQPKFGLVYFKFVT